MNPEDLNHLMVTQDNLYQAVAPKIDAQYQAGQMSKARHKAIREFIAYTWGVSFSRWEISFQTRDVPELEVKSWVSGLKKLQAYGKKNWALPTTDDIPTKISGYLEGCQIGGVEMTPSQFRSICESSLASDPDGNNCVLRVACTIGDQTFSKEIELDPIIKRVRQLIANYHTHLHESGKPITDTDVRGIGDWFQDAVQSAKRIAESKAAKDLYHDVSEHESETSAVASFIPGGNLALTAARSQGLLVKAKQGDPKAKEDIKKIAAKADSGDPHAITTMRIMSKMNEKIKEDPSLVSETQEPQDEGGDDVKLSGLGAGYESAPERNYFLDIEGDEVEIGSRRPSHRRGSHRRHRTNPNAPHEVSRDDGGGGGGDDGGGDDDGGSDDGDIVGAIDDAGDWKITIPVLWDDNPDHDVFSDALHRGEAVVSGWLYNKPYRTNSEHLIDMEKSPGVSLSLRELYNRGLGREPTSKSTILKQALRKAL